MYKARQSRLPVRWRRPTTRAQQAVPAHEDNVQHGQRKERINRLFLGYVAEYHVGDAVRGIDPPLSTLRLHKAQQPAKQRRLTRAIRAHEANKIPCAESELNPPQDHAAPVSKSRVPYVYQPLAVANHSLARSNSWERSD